MLLRTISQGVGSTAFIKTQKIVRDGTGKIISGSASLVDAVYDPDRKYKSKQVQREKLGKVLYLSDDKKVGVFMSPTRGLVEYDATTDIFSAVDRGDPRIDDSILFPEPEIHTVFGDAYLLLTEMAKTGITAIIREVFPCDEEYERAMLHIAHSTLSNCSRTPCDLFTERSFISYLFPDVPLASLASDTQFFTMMGDDRTKVALFKAYVKSMRRKYKGFGKACYLDSTPLPSEMRDNPFLRLCSHGLTATEVQMRLVLFLDEETGKPVWYEIVPGNLLDVNTLGPMLENVETTLNINVVSMILDAGYVSKELVGRYSLDCPGPESGENREYIARMPNKAGCPYKELYRGCEKLFPNAKYTFLRDGHRYFGLRRETEVFGYRMYAYVYLDFDNALWKFEKYYQDHVAEFEALTDKEKTKKTYEFGFFVLISNTSSTPAEILDKYFQRVDIESFFKTSKEYLGLLPLSKWTDTTVRGKILADILSTIVYLDLRATARRAEASMTRVIGATQSLMCTKKGDRVRVESPNRHCKDAYANYGLEVPSSLSIESFKDKVVQL